MRGCHDRGLGQGAGLAPGDKGHQLTGERMVSQFSEGHLGDCAVWRMRGERSGQAAFSWKMLEASSVPSWGHPPVAFLSADLSEELRDLLFSMQKCFLRSPENHWKTLMDEIVLIGAKGLIILDINGNVTLLCL